MDESNSGSPATWTATDVATWAVQAKLAESTVLALKDNEVDGPTLVTLSKAEIQSELGITSLPGRRCLWEHIKGLRAEQETNDYSTAIKMHQDEIQAFASPESDDSFLFVSDRTSYKDRDAIRGVVDQLTTDAQRQSQIIDDHLLAHRLQRAITLGQEVYEDRDFAKQEQRRLNELLAQSESDLQFAESLASRRDRTASVARRQERDSQVVESTRAKIAQGQSAAENRVTSLFGLCVQSCVENKVNVADAFHDGKVKSFVLPLVVSDDEEDGDFDDKKKPAALNISYIQQCNVCYNEELRGFQLACGHCQCIRCAKKLFRVALGDNTLLPLRCCELPIDMNIAGYLLNESEAALLTQRAIEVEATNKMYCPTCSGFLNLDLLDASVGTDLICGCGAALCVPCKSLAHRGLTCRENKTILAGSDDLILELASENGWKQCPGCSAMIELRSGCNHMTCQSCRYEFCFRCLRRWNSGNGQCSSGECELWDEDRLLEAGEARVQQEEAARGRVIPQEERGHRLRRAMEGLRANEICDHEWERVDGYKGECPNCGWQMEHYGMECFLIVDPQCATHVHTIVFPKVDGASCKAPGHKDAPDPWTVDCNLLLCRNSCMMYLFAGTTASKT